MCRCRVIPVVMVSAVVALFSVPALADKPASQVTAQASWDPPLSHELSKVAQVNRPKPQIMAPVPESARPCARWITDLAALALRATGKVTGAGRDTTADIGKSPLGIHIDQYQPVIRGAIK